MEKKAYITEEEQEKCRRVADAFAELEDVDVVVVDVGRYGFVKLQYYTPPTGFENDFTFTDSMKLFDDLWEEWLHTQLVMLAKRQRTKQKLYNHSGEDSRSAVLFPAVFKERKVKIWQMQKQKSRK
mgnify:CR=1 FL=1